MADATNTTPAPVALTPKGMIYCAAHDAPLDAVSGLLANAMLAATLARRPLGPTAVEGRQVPAKPAPAAARDLVTA